MPSNAPLVNYSWIGYQSDLPKEEQSTEQVVYGAKGELTIVARVFGTDEGADIDIKSTGIVNSKHLLDIISGIHAVVQQDYMETQKESRERRAEPAMGTEDTSDGRDVV